MVADADAVAQPPAVVIEPAHASSAVEAVLQARRWHEPTPRACECGIGPCSEDAGAEDAGAAGTAWSWLAVGAASRRKTHLGPRRLARKAVHAQRHVEERAGGGFELRLRRLHGLLVTP